MAKGPQLTRIKHPVEPGEQLLGAVVGVHDDRDAVQGGDGADIVGAGNGTGNGSFLLFGAVLDALAGKEGGTALRALDYNRGLRIASGFKTRNTVAKERVSSIALARDIGGPGIHGHGGA
jgi:hypothetical protein